MHVLAVIARAYARERAQVVAKSVLATAFTSCLEFTLCLAVNAISTQNSNMRSEVSSHNVAVQHVTKVLCMNSSA